MRDLCMYTIQHTPNSVHVPIPQISPIPMLFVWFSVTRLQQHDDNNNYKYFKLTKPKFRMKIDNLCKKCEQWNKILVKKICILDVIISCGLVLLNYTFAYTNFCMPQQKCPHSMMFHFPPFNKSPTNSGLPHALQQFVYYVMKHLYAQRCFSVNNDFNYTASISCISIQKY